VILSRLRLNPRSREAARDLADCQELHRTISSAFPGSAGAPVRAQFGILYRVEYPSTILIQSYEQPDFARLAHGYLMGPAESKDVADAWDRIGNEAVLRFRLRANPTRKIDSKSGLDGIRRNGKRVELRTELEQLDWLRRKAAKGGFEIIAVRSAAQVPDVRVTGEGKIRGQRAWTSGSREKHRLTFASVLFEGKLRVEDRDRFRATLEHGVGSAKAYGFGLLSIAPAE
jgi:CRISPR system Cascade subunit CasE